MPPSKRSNTAFGCPDEMKFATEGMQGDYWHIYRLLLELFYSRNLTFYWNFTLGGFPLNGPIFLRSRCGVNLCRPMLVARERLAGAMLLYLNIPPSHHPHTKPLILPAKVSPLKYISPWLALSGVDYEAREETFSQWKGKLEPGAVMQLQHGNR
jgi:hypothetical protein